VGKVRLTAVTLDSVDAKKLRDLSEALDIGHTTLMRLIVGYGAHHWNPDTIPELEEA